MDKRLLFSFILFLLVYFCKAQAPIYKYAIFDDQGKQVLSFEYDAVQLSNNQGYLILKKGDKLVSVDQAGNTSETTSIIDSTKTESRFVEIDPPSSKYDLALKYANGFVKVRNTKTKKGGILNLKGKEIVKCKYDWFYLDILENGLIKGKEGNSYKLFNTSGKELGEFEDIGSKFKNDRLLVVQEDRYGFVDKTGKLVLPIIYKRARAFSDNYAFVIQDDTAFYINPSGEKIINLPISTHDGQAFHDGVVVVKDKNSNHSVVTDKGEVLFTQHFSHLDNFQNGLSAAKQSYKGDTWGVVDKFGKKILPFKYHETRVFNLNGKSLIAVRKAIEQKDIVIEGSNKKPSITAKAYCYTAVLRTPKVNALGATHLHTQALFIELYAPYRMPSDEVKKRGKELTLNYYPQGKITQEFFTEVENCLEIRSKLGSQISVDESKLIEEHIE